MLLAVLVVTDTEFQIVGAALVEQWDSTSEDVRVAGIEVQCPTIAEFSAAGSRLRENREIHILPWTFDRLT